MRCSEESIPKIRFSGYEGKWKKQKLGKLLTLSFERNDGTYNRNDVLAAALGTELQKKQIFFGLKATDESVKNYRLVRPGDVVYTKSPIKGFPNGIVRASKGVWGIVPTLYCVYHSKDEISANIIQAYFEDKTRLEEFLKPLVNVGARNNVNITDAGLLEGYICLPVDRKEQEAILAFLSSVDETIAASEQEVANLETQKKAVMKKIFSQEVQFKRENGSDFPEWEEKELVELFPYIRNGFVGTITDFFTVKENGIRYLQGTNIHDGLISDNTEFYVTKEFHQKHINNELKADDIIMVQSGHVGDCAVVGKKYKGANCHALIIMSNAGECCSDFYVAYFHSPEALKEIAMKATGNTVKHILASVMQGFRVPYPCLEEQRLIADFLSDFDEAITAAKKELELWKELKKGLLQQMFV